MKDFLPAIRNSALFHGLSDEEAESMLHCLGAKAAEYAKGAFILRAGDSTASVGLVTAGSALVVQEDFWGNRNLMGRVSPGSLFAETFACVPGSVLNVSVVADAPCTVLWLGVQRILTTCPTACAHHSHVVRNLLSDLAVKNLQFNEKLTHMGRRTTRDKLLSYLSAQAQRQGKAEFDIPFSRQQLADYLSVERSAMSVELCKLRDAGVLTFDKNHFALLTKQL